MSSSIACHLLLRFYNICFIWHPVDKIFAKFWCRLPLHVIFLWTFMKLFSSPYFRFKIWERFNQRLLRYFNYKWFPRYPVGWVGLWHDNHTTSWPYLASWDLLDFQLGWDFKIGPSVATWTLEVEETISAFCFILYVYMI